MKEAPMPRIVPSLWFDTEALVAAEFYCSVFPDSEIRAVSRHPEGGIGEPGSVLAVRFTLDGQPVTALNGGTRPPFTEAVSLLIECADQAEIDHYWARLTDGGQESRCGWLTDRFGLSWQVVPADMGALFDGAYPQRAMRAMLGMRKLDIEALRRAAAGG
jgi:predicted 3-demethylubiquinone-9 3-methyltransferase (glyoxalase superfamily)